MEPTPTSPNWGPAVHLAHPPLREALRRVFHSCLFEMGSVWVTGMEWGTRHLLSHRAAEGGGHEEGTGPWGRAEQQLIAGSVSFILPLERIWRLFPMYPHGLRVQPPPTKPLQLLGLFKEERTNPHRRGILTSALLPFFLKQHFPTILQTNKYLKSLPHL